VSDRLDPTDECLPPDELDAVRRQALGFIWQRQDGSSDDQLSAREVEALVCVVVLRTGCKPGAVLGALAELKLTSAHLFEERKLDPGVAADLEYASELRGKNWAAFKIVSGAIRARIEGRDEAYRWLRSVAYALVG
jgi:hypothetical protein